MQYTLADVGKGGMGPVWANITTQYFNAVSCSHSMKTFEIDMMAHELFKLDLSSESDSNEELDELVLYSLIKRKKSQNSDFMKKRKSRRICFDNRIIWKTIY